MGPQLYIDFQYFSIYLGWNLRQENMVVLARKLLFQLRLSGVSHGQVLDIFAADSGRLSHDNIGTNDMGMEQDWLRWACQ